MPIYLRFPKTPKSPEVHEVPGVDLSFFKNAFLLYFIFLVFFNSLFDDLHKKVL